VTTASIPFSVSIPNAARIYDYFLGGKDNYIVDRIAAQRMVEVLPGIAGACRGNREFLQRAVRFLAGEAGIRQFLDIGTGLPTMGNVHEIAQEITPGARVAYVDYDSGVLTHARAILATSPDVAVIEGDLRSPDAILAEVGMRRLIDFRKPVALLMVAVLHFVGDDEDPYGNVRALVGALPGGSYLALTHSTADDVPAEVTEEMVNTYANASAQVTPRTYADVRRFFEGLELVAPGLVNVADWRPQPGSYQPSEGRSLVYGGVAVKP
jgi:S-adenosyl methyltransferase